MDAHRLRSTARRQEFLGADDRHTRGDHPKVTCLNWSIASNSVCAVCCCKTPHTHAVPAMATPGLKAIHRPRRLGLAVGVPGRDPLPPALGACRHVAIHSQQRHYRGLPQPKGAHQKTSLWLPKLRSPKMCIEVLRGQVIWGGGGIRLWAERQGNAGRNEIGSPSQTKTCKLPEAAERPC